MPALLTRMSIWPIAALDGGDSRALNLVSKQWLACGGKRPTALYRFRPAHLACAPGKP
jgi:hypothetical protein